MVDDYPAPGRAVGDDGADVPPPVGADPAQDRYVIPEPEEIVPTYVRHEAPWGGFGPSVAAPPAPSEESEFTRILRKRRRGKETLAWAVTGACIVTAAWFLPILLAPTSQLGRVGSFAVLALGGFVALTVLWRTWRWAHGKE